MDGLFAFANVAMGCTAALIAGSCIALVYEYRMTLIEHFLDWWKR